MASPQPWIIVKTERIASDAVRVGFGCGHSVVLRLGEDPIHSCPKCEAEAVNTPRTCPLGHVVGTHTGPCRFCSAVAALWPAEASTERDTVTLRTSDYGAAPKPGESSLSRGYFVTVPLNDGRILRLEFGPTARRNFENLLLQAMLDESSQ